MPYNLYWISSGHDWSWRAPEPSTLMYRRLDSARHVLTALALSNERACEAAPQQGQLFCEVTWRTADEVGEVPSSWHKARTAPRRVTDARVSRVMARTRRRSRVTETMWEAHIRESTEQQTPRMRRQGMTRAITFDGVKGHD